MTVTVTVEDGEDARDFAGVYEYTVLTSGWPPGLGIIDNGALVKATAEAPALPDEPPTIDLQFPENLSVHTYKPATGLPVTVSISFSAGLVSPTNSPVETMSATVSSTTQTIPVTLTTSALPSASPTATGSVDLTTPGNYTVTVAATNSSDIGTSYASAQFSVDVEAPPPEITPSSPTAGSSFSYTLGGAGASVPVSFSATSIYGNITSLTASLDGSPIDGELSLSGVNTATTASGSATLTVPTEGSHSLVLSAANDYGAPTSVTIPFSVASVVPTPTVSILSPANGANFSRVSGDPATVVNYSFEGGTSYGTITSTVVKLDGATITSTVNGLNTASITGSGALNFTAGGSHTLNVTLFNDGGAQASTSTSFTITQTNPQTCRDLIWLPPISHNKTIKGGSKMPIKFTLQCDGKFIRDTSVLIAIYEVFQNGTTSTPVIYPYGTGSPNPPDYAIKGKHYELNFKTAKGVHSYQVEVYSSATGAMQLLGTKEINTKGKKQGGGHHDDDDDDDDDHGGHGDHDDDDCDD